MPSSDINFPERIIAAYADGHCKQIASQVIRELRAMEADYLHCMDDVCLQNVWEEICALLLHPEEPDLDELGDLLDAHIARKVDALAEHEKTAIWWQTDSPGRTFYRTDKDVEGFPYTLCAIIDHIFNEYILPAALNSRSKRVKAWVEAQTS